MGIRHITFKNTPGKYELKLLPARKCRLAFAKAISLLAPLASASYDTYSSHLSNLQTAQKDIDDGIIPEDDSVSFFEIAIVLSQQTERPEFDELFGLLTEGLTKDGKEFDFDTEFTGRLDDQLKIIEFAFKENLAVPFVRWLEDKGFAEMFTTLQSSMVGLLAQGKV